MIQIIEDRYLSGSQKPQARVDLADRLRDEGAGRPLRLRQVPARRLGRRRYLLRRAERRHGNGIVDQLRLPRFKTYTNYDNYVGVGTWTKIGLNNTDYNDQAAFDAGTSLFTAPVDGTYIFGATLLYKVNASTTARMRGRLVLNGVTEIRGSVGESSATHVTLATAIWLQTMAPPTTGDTVELQGYFRAQNGYFAADHTSFWGCKIG